MASSSILPQGTERRSAMSRLKRRLPLVAALLATGGAAAGIAYASIPSGGVINACYQKSGGALRVIGTEPTVGGGACSNGERALSWNVRGVTGATGATGETGPSGPAGVPSAYGVIFGRADPVRFDAAKSHSIVSIVRLGPAGGYCVFLDPSIDLTKAVAVATLDLDFGLISVDAGGCGPADASGLQIATTTPDGTPADMSFQVVVFP